MYREVDDGADRSQQDRAAEQARLREVMREERENISEGDKPDDLETIEHVGEPEKLAEYGTYQMDEGESGRYDCAVVTQQNALEALGVETTTEEIRQLGENMNPPAYGRGENAPNGLNGTITSEVGYAFEEKGVGRETYTYSERDGNDIMDGSEPVNHLRNELSEGHAVIAVVDSPSFYNYEAEQPMNHAVWVTDAAFTPDGKLDHIHVNDPGVPDGQNKVYDGETFINAWRETDYRTVSSEVSFPFWDQQEK